MSIVTHELSQSTLKYAKQYGSASLKFVGDSSCFIPKTMIFRVFLNF